MPRKGPPTPRVITPDPIYNSELAQSFINRMMMGGKKTVAERIFYTAMAKAEAEAQIPALEIFEKAMANVMPTMEVRARRVGGQNYQVPMDVRPARRRTLALRWMVTNARKRKAERSMVDKLAAEFLDAYKGSGTSVKKKDDTHRMADANKAFSHYKF